MIGLDADTLAAAMMGCGTTRAAVHAPHLAAAMATFEINSPRRGADFLAQVGHESLGLKFPTELWGPTPEQVRYERDFAQPWGTGLPRAARNFKPFGLGNGTAGDGRRYCGRGWIMVTGRANYGRARDFLRARLGPTVPDFVLEPEALALPKWAALSAGEFWARHDLNQYSDSGDFEQQTRVINGGLNGLADRQQRREVARQALGAT